MPKFKCDILSHFETVCSQSGIVEEHDNEVDHRNEYDESRNVVEMEAIKTEPGPEALA